MTLYKPYFENDKQEQMFPAIGDEFIYQYARPSVTTDVVVFLEQLNEEVEVLLIKRGDKTEACASMWALPGGYMEIDETTRVAAARELLEETGLNVYLNELKLVGVYDKVDRDKRGRVITVAYTVRIHKKAEVRPTEGFEEEVSEYKWANLYKDIINNSDCELAFDHEQIIKDAYEQMGT